MNIYHGLLVSGFVIILTTFCNSTDVIPKNEVEKKLLYFFTKWRCGDSNLLLILPPLDIITVTPMNGKYQGKGVNLVYSSSEMQLSGMNNFSVVDLRVILGNFGMHARGSLRIPTLTITADCYEMHGSAFHMYSLNGSGKLSATFQNISLSFLLFIASNGTGSSIRELKLDFVVDNAQVDLQNSSWPINKVLNSEGVKILEGYRSEILRASENSIKRKFENYLKTVTPTQLLDMVSR